MNLRSKYLNHIIILTTVIRSSQAKVISSYFRAFIIHHPVHAKVVVVMPFNQLLLCAVHFPDIFIGEIYSAKIWGSNTKLVGYLAVFSDNGFNTPCQISSYWVSNTIT